MEGTKAPVVPPVPGEQNPLRGNEGNKVGCGFDAFDLGWIKSHSRLSYEHRQEKKRVFSPTV